LYRLAPGALDALKIVRPETVIRWFTGGTGKYAGITGSGDYHVVLISDTALWDELRGEYKIPGDKPTTGSAAPPR
jgi:hypothetical protein